MMRVRLASLGVLFLAASSGPIARAAIEYGFDFLDTSMEGGGFELLGGLPIVVERQQQAGTTFGTLGSELLNNTLTTRGASTLDSSFDGTKLRIVASLDQLRAERTDGSYSSVFAQGESYFQIWVMPRGQSYEYTCRVSQAFDEGLVPVFGADPPASLTAFTVLQGVGGGPNGERGDWFFSGLLPPGDYQWYGGISAAAATEGPALRPLGGSILVEVEFLPVPTDRTWVGLDQGTFAQPGHWDPVGTPGLEDRAIFHTPGDADEVVVFDQPATNARLLVTAPSDRQSSQRVFDLGGQTYALTREWNDQGGASATIGDQERGIARLRVVNGRVDARDAELGRVGYGELAVGVDATWSAYQHMISVGSNGGGRLEITNGGRVEHGHGLAGRDSGSNGEIVVRGVHPVQPLQPSAWQVTGWFGLGIGGRGRLGVEQGGHAEIGKCEMACSPGAEGFAEISGDGSRWELVSGWEVSLIVGKAAAASVTTSNGGSIVNQGEIHLAENPGSIGSLIVDGPGRNELGDPVPALDCNQRLTVGYGGVGDFQVLADAGAIVRGALIVGTDPDAPAGTHSSVTVDGLETQLEVLGNDGEGSAIGMEIGRQGQDNSLTITNGAQIFVDYDASIGGSVNGEGTLLIDGFDSLLVPRLQLEVGRDGPGEATVSNGGRIHVDGANADPEWGENYKGLTFIGMRSTGTLTITGVNGETPSSLESSAQIVVGVNTGGNGTLIIQQGAQALSWKHTSATQTAGIVGREAGCSGHVRIEDGSRWEMPDGGLTVGWMGSGRLDMTGGIVCSTYGIIGRTPGSQGNVQISGMIGTEPSHWNIDGSLAIGGDLADNAGGAGLLSIGQDCWVWTSGHTRIHAPGTLSLSQGRLDTASVTLAGTIEGFGAVISRVTNSGGLIHPTDLGTGVSRELYFERGYDQQSGGTFMVDVAADGNYSAIRTYDGVYGHSLAGTLRVRILNGYVPPFGSAFDIAYAEGGVVAAFDTIDLPTVGGQPVFELYMENPNTLRMRTILEYFAPVDVDRDGDVDSDDRDAFEFCATGPGIAMEDQNCTWADLDSDTDIDQTDFGVFQRCYGGENVPVNAGCAE